MAKVVGMTTLLQITHDLGDTVTVDVGYSTYNRQHIGAELRIQDIVTAEEEGKLFRV